jgi:hypothetical protein
MRSLGGTKGWARGLSREMMARLSEGEIGSESAESAEFFKPNSSLRMFRVINFLPILPIRVV